MRSVRPFIFLLLAFSAGWSRPPCLAAELVWTDSAQTAWTRATEANGLVLVLGVSESCGPCQLFKRSLRTDPSYEALLDRVAVLELAAEGTNFNRFVARYPQGFEGMVPMVYLLDRQGTLLFVRSGAPSLEELSGLIRTHMPPAASPLTQPLVRDSIPPAEAQRVISSAGRATTLKELVESLQGLQRVLKGADEPAGVHAMAFAAVPILKERMEGQLHGLESSLLAGTEIHHAAFRLTELFLQLGDYPDLRGETRRLLIKFRDDPSTRSAVLQSMDVVRGRIAEHREDRGRAMTSYRSVLARDARSPLGEFAQRRLLELARRNAGGLVQMD